MDAAALTELGVLRLQENNAQESAALLRVGMEVLQGEAGVRVDYLAVVDANTMLPVERVEAGTLVAVAGYAGKTRLIDNFLVS